MNIYDKKNNIDSELVLSEILNLTPNYVFWKNKQLVFQGCNLQFAQQFGCKNLNEIIGKTDDDFPWAQSELKEKYRKDDLYVIQTGESLLNIEEEQIQTDGSIKTVLLSKVPLKNSSGEIVGILGTYVDISYLKAIERSLKDSKEKAEIANRAKTEFLSNISHDVVTPLISMDLLGKMIAEDADLNEEQSDRGKDIAKCARQLLTFFEDCLRSSNVELSAWNLEEETFSFETILESIQALFQPTAERMGLSLAVNMDENFPKKLRGYRKNIYRVVLNLVGNALKFTKQGSVTVRIFLENKVNEKNILVGIEVKDTGVGIPEDKQEIIFKKSQRLASAFNEKIEGSGMGLYMVDQYVKRMNGTIHVKSMLGEGSVFTVLLPMMFF